MRRKKIKLLDMITDKELTKMLNSLTWHDSPSKYNEYVAIKELPVFWQRWLYADKVYFVLEGLTYVVEAGTLARKNPKTIKLKPLPPRWKTIEIK